MHTHPGEKLEMSMKKESFASQQASNVARGTGQWPPFLHQWPCWYPHLRPPDQSIRN